MHRIPKSKDAFMTTTLQALADFDQVTYELGMQIAKSLVDQLNRSKANCLNCEHFLEKEEQCAIAGYLRPPARVIAFGCDKFNEGPPF